MNNDVSSARKMQMHARMMMSMAMSMPMGMMSRGTFRQPGGLITR